MVPRRHFDVYVRKCKLSADQWHQFNNELNSILASKTLGFDSKSHDVNEYAQILTDTYQYLINKYMPLTKLSRAERRYIKKPWITSALKKSISKKNLLYRLSKRKNDPSITLKYNQYRNLLTKLKRNAKENYHRDKLIEFGHNKSKTWQIINEITSRKRKGNQNSPKSIINGHGEKIEEPGKIASVLNEHFGTVGQKMADKIDDSDLNSCVKDPLEYIEVPHTSDGQNLFEFDKIDVSQVKRVISGLQTKKACGYDSISNNILKNTTHVVAPYITTLFNSCIEQGSFPNIYKIAKVIPLFKGGDAKDVNCYRPISLLPAFGKLLEKLFSFQVVEYFEKFDLFCKQQFGFRKNYGTEYAILDITEKILKNLDSNLHTCSIFLNLAKAFDFESVSHETLLKKLHKYGIRGKALALFRSYLRRCALIILNREITIYLCG